MKGLIDKFLAKITRRDKVKIFADKKQEVLIKLGREQFQKLVDRGLFLG